MRHPTYARSHGSGGHGGSPGPISRLPHCPHLRPDTVLCPKCAPATDAPLTALTAEDLAYALAAASPNPSAWETIDAAPRGTADKILKLYLATTQNLLEHPLKTLGALEAETPQNKPRSARPCRAVSR